MAWLAQESTGCEGREENMEGGERGDAGGCMREGGGAVAPVKIDPPHSFPTFSPREVCYHERGWDEEEEEDVEEGETGVTAQGVSRGLPTIASVSVYPHLWIFANVLVCIHVYVFTRIYACARARSLAPHWERERQAHVGARGQIRDAVV